MNTYSINFIEKIPKSQSEKHDIYNNSTKIGSWKCIPGYLEKIWFSYFRWKQDKKMQVADYLPFYMPSVDDRDSSISVYH